jgi:hypothetical protein
MFSSTNLSRERLLVTQLLLVSSSMLQALSMTPLQFKTFFRPSVLRFPRTPLELNSVYGKLSSPSN